MLTPTICDSARFRMEQRVYREITQPDSPVGINDSGDILGSGYPFPVLLSSSGARYAIAYPGALSTYASGLTNRKNNTVGVVGNYYSKEGQWHGFYAVVRLSQ